MQRYLSLKIFFILFLTGHGLTFAQDTSHANERVQADALATAYADCNHSLTYLEYQADKENRHLSEKLKELAQVKNQLFVSISPWYHDKPEMKKKFDKELKWAKKKLKKCIKYQGIIDTRAEEEKQKAKESG